MARWAAGAAGDGEGDGDGGKGGKSAEQVLEEEREETLAAVRSSVLWFLGRELEKVAEWQRGMVERRVKREVERGRSVLYLVKGGVSDGYGDGGQTQAEPGQDGDWRRGGVGGGKYGFEAAQAAEAEEEEKKKSSGRRRVEGVEEQLTPEQLQLFASENRDMLKHYEDTLDQVRYVSFILLFPSFRFLASSLAILSIHPSINSISRYIRTTTPFPLTPLNRTVNLSTPIIFF